MLRKAIWQSDVDIEPVGVGDMVVVRPVDMVPEALAWLVEEGMAT